MVHSNCTGEYSVKLNTAVRNKMLMPWEAATQKKGKQN